MDIKVKIKDVYLNEEAAVYVEKVQAKADTLLKNRLRATIAEIGEREDYRPQHMAFSLISMGYLLVRNHRPKEVASKDFHILTHFAKEWMKNST